jgi:hypothetical protein
MFTICISMIWEGRLKGRETGMQIETEIGENALGYQSQICPRPPTLGIRGKNPEGYHQLGFHITCPIFVF